MPTATTRTLYFNNLLPRIWQKRKYALGKQSGKLLCSKTSKNTVESQLRSLAKVTLIELGDKKENVTQEDHLSQSRMFWEMTGQIIKSSSRTIHFRLLMALNHSPASDRYKREPLPGDIFRRRAIQCLCKPEVIYDKLGRFPP